MTTSTIWSLASGCLALCLVLSQAGAVDVNALFSNTQTGDGTYYGTVYSGNCRLDGSHAPTWVASQGLVPVAINAAQYGTQTGSPAATCGLCVLVTATGSGSGADPISNLNGGQPFVAFVDNKCPECASGDLDLGLVGDGRWDITWTAVECPVEGGKISYFFEGSGDWYLKIQPTAGVLPVASMKIQVSGGWRQGTKTDDNFFEFTGWSSALTLSDPLPVKLTSTAGEEISDTIQYVSTVNDVRVASSTGGSQFTTSSSTGTPTIAPTRTPTGTPTIAPTAPTGAPIIEPTRTPTGTPTIAPSEPTGAPTQTPTKSPTPTTRTPTRAPTHVPTAPTQSQVSDVPSAAPTIAGISLSAITVKTVVQFAGALSTVQQTQVKNSYRHRLEITFSAVATQWMVTLVASRRSSATYTLQGVAEAADIAEFQSTFESTAVSFQANLQAQLALEGYTGVSVDEFSFTATTDWESSSSTSDNGSSLGSGATIGIVLSCIAVVGIGGGIGYVMYRRGTWRGPIPEDVDVPGLDGADLEAPLTPRKGRYRGGDVVQDTNLDATESSRSPIELEQM